MSLTFERLFVIRLLHNAILLLLKLFIGIIVEFNIGQKIKALRKGKKLTLQDVANETGFSPALISQIENNNVSPPIATLSKIARFFDVKMSHFFEDPESTMPYEIVRHNERRQMNRVISTMGTNHGYTYEALSYRKHNKKNGAIPAHCKRARSRRNTL